MPLKDGFFSTATQTSCCNRIQRSNRVRLLVVSTHDFPDRNKENRNTEVHGGGGLELVKPAREPASSRPKPCAFLKKPHESCPFAAPCGPRRKKN